MERINQYEIFEMKKPNFLEKADFENLRVLAFNDVLKTEKRIEKEIEVRNGEDKIIIDFGNIRDLEEEFSMNMGLVQFLEKDIVLGKIMFITGKEIDTKKEDFGLYKYHVVEP